MSTYKGQTDEEVVQKAKDGDELALECLLKRYKNFVRQKSKTYFIAGADKDDLVQEGLIGLYKAVRDFKEEKLSSFRAFAELCVTRQIITAIKAATRQKHVPLNQAVSLSKPVNDEDTDRTLADVLGSDRFQDPAEIFLRKEMTDDLYRRIRENMSPLEAKVLNLYMEGRSYQEIADTLDRHVKSIDNSLQRIKRKVAYSLGLTA